MRRAGALRRRREDRAGRGRGPGRARVAGAGRQGRPHQGRAGEADAGLVYRTDVKAADGEVTGIEFPEAAKAVNDYPIVEVAKAPNSALAKDFIKLVLGEQGKAVLTKAGFEAP